VAEITAVSLGAVGAGLDRAIFHKVAQATVRSLLARIADALSRPQGSASAVRETDMTQPATRLAAPEKP
jgi:hypothetical protein